MASTEESIPTVKTRVLIISDTHTADLHHSGSKHAFRHPLPKADVLLHCGDLTMVGKLKELDKVLEMLGKIDAELKLVIAGNHDISLDQPFYARRGWSMQDKDYKRDVPELAMSKMKGKQAQDAGVTYLDEGMHSFTLKSGAKFNVCPHAKGSNTVLTVTSGVCVSIPARVS
jgi:predicted phosphodiesterase